MKISFCHKYGRMILVGFDFCPYCGAIVKASQPEEALPRDPRLRPGAVEEASEPDAFPAKTAPLPRDGRLLLDRLIRDLEALDNEIADIEIRGR